MKIYAIKGMAPATRHPKPLRRDVSCRRRAKARRARFGPKRSSADVRRAAGRRRPRRPVPGGRAAAGQRSERDGPRRRRGAAATRPPKAPRARGLPLTVARAGSEGQPGYLKQSMKLPKSWATKPLLEVLKLFCQTYNKKFPDAQIDIDAYHFERPLGSTLFPDDHVGAALTEYRPRRPSNVRSGSPRRRGRDADSP